MPNLKKPQSMQPPEQPQRFGSGYIPPNYSSADVEDRRNEPKTLSDWGVEPIEKPGKKTGLYKLHIGEMVVPKGDVESSQYNFRRKTR